MSEAVDSQIPAKDFRGYLADVKHAGTAREIEEAMAKLSDTQCFKGHGSPDTPFISLSNIPGVPSNTRQTAQVAQFVQDAGIPIRIIHRNLHEHGKLKIRTYYLVPIQVALAIPQLEEVRKIEGRRRLFSPRQFREHKIHGEILSHSSPLSRRLYLMAGRHLKSADA